jgi:hypothetical protein
MNIEWPRHPTWPDPLIRQPGFPIAVPATQFGDYHRQTGTRILLTERIRFGHNGIEPQHHKCLDYQMPEPLQHYRALLTAVARLAGTHRTGRLPADLTANFPRDVRTATVGERTTLSAAKIDRRVTQLAEFAETEPGLLPANVGSREFLARLREDAPRFAQHEQTVVRLLAADSDYVALCHWNANIDNAWFWRDSDDAPHCGLLDWGCVSRMNLGMALWGALSGAETAMWSKHLDELLRLVVGEFHRCGGRSRARPVTPAHRTLATMGVAWLLDVPAVINKRFGADAPASRTDPHIKDDESIRAPLQMLLNLWERHRPGDMLDAALAEESRR